MEAKNEIQKKDNAAIANAMALGANGIKLGNLQEMRLFADTLIASQLVPAHFNTSAKVIVALQAGMELGLKPWQSLNQLYVVNGKVGMLSQCMAGMIRRNEVCRYFRQDFDGAKGTDEYCAVVVSKRKDDESEHRTEFSIYDAKMAGLWGKAGPWKMYPSDMLMWRAIARHARYFYGDVMMGVSVVEEEMDMPRADYEPTTPRREERKQIESTVQPDINTIDDIFARFVELLPEYADSDMVQSYWLQFVSFVCRGAPSDYITAEGKFKASALNDEAVANLSKTLEAGIPDPVLEMIPKVEVAK